MEALAVLFPLLTVALAFYFLPTLLAWRRHHHHTPAVFALNVLCPPIFVALVILGIAICRQHGWLMSETIGLW